MDCSVDGGTAAAVGVGVVGGSLAAVESGKEKEKEKERKEKERKRKRKRNRKRDGGRREFKSQSLPNQPKRGEKKEKRKKKKKKTYLSV